MQVDVFPIIPGSPERFFDPARVLSGNWQDKDFVIRLLRGTDSIKICESTHYIYKKYSLPRRVLMRKRCQWLFYRQKMIQKNFSGFNKYSSMVVQGTYDIVKLCYEGVFQYRL